MLAGAVRKTNVWLFGLACMEWPGFLDWFLWVFIVGLWFSVLLVVWVGVVVGAGWVDGVWGAGQGGGRSGSRAGWSWHGRAGGYAPQGGAPPGILIPRFRSSCNFKRHGLPAVGERVTGRARW